MINNIYPVAFLVVVFVLCLIFLYYRASLRRRLLQKARKYFVKENIIADEGQTSRMLFRAIFFDLQSLKLLKSHLANVPESLRKDYLVYRKISAVTYVLLVLLILTSCFSYLLV